MYFDAFEEPPTPSRAVLKLPSGFWYFQGRTLASVGGAVDDVAEDASTNGSSRSLFAASTSTAPRRCDGLLGMPVCIFAFCILSMGDGSLRASIFNLDVERLSEEDDVKGEGCERKVRPDSTEGDLGLIKLPTPVTCFIDSVQRGNLPDLLAFTSGILDCWST